MVIKSNNRVGGDNAGFKVIIRNLFGLCGRHPSGKLRGQFAWFGDFVDGSWNNLVLQAQLGKVFLPSGRGRGKDERAAGSKHGDKGADYWGKIDEG